MQTVTTLGSGSGAVVTPDNVLDAITRCKTNAADPKVIVCHAAHGRAVDQGEGRRRGLLPGADLGELAGTQHLFGAAEESSRAAQISITEDVGGATKSWLAVVDPARWAWGSVGASKSTCS